MMETLLKVIHLEKIIGGTGTGTGFVYTSNHDNSGSYTVEMDGCASSSGA